MAIRCSPTPRMKCADSALGGLLKKSAFIHSSELIKEFSARRDVTASNVSWRPLRRARSNIPPTVEPFEVFFNSLLVNTDGPAHAVPWVAQADEARPHLRGGGLARGERVLKLLPHLVPAV